MTESLHQFKPSIFNRLSAWILHHLQSMIFSLGKLYRSPTSTLMTIAVIGITLTLPGGFYLLLKNIENISGDLKSSTQISLYLDMELSLDKAQTLTKELNTNPNISNTELTTRNQALEDFKIHSGLGESIEHLKENPLPHTIMVQPAADLDALNIKTLLSKLEAMPEVDIAKLDTEWLERLYTIIEIAKRTVIIISLLFSFAVLLTIGNTIRLDIQSRYQEIIVTKLIGATNAFIRRPFLYGGIWFGLFGGLLSWIIIELSAIAISKPFAYLNHLYQSNFELMTFSLFDFIILITSSTLLGLAGSWLAVARHLNDIEPK